MVKTSYTNLLLISDGGRLVLNSWPGAHTCPVTVDIALGPAPPPRHLICPSGDQIRDVQSVLRHSLVAGIPAQGRASEGPSVSESEPEAVPGTALRSQDSGRAVLIGYHPRLPTCPG